MQAIQEKLSDLLHIAWIALRTRANSIKEMEYMVIRQAIQLK